MVVSKAIMPFPTPETEPLLNPSALIGQWFVLLCGLTCSEAFNSCGNFLQIQKWRHISGENERFKKNLFFFVLRGQASVLTTRA